MKYVVKIFAIFLYSIFLIYLILPSTEFPDPPADSIQSREPADLESPFRRAYFTNFTRDQVMSHYIDGYSNNFAITNLLTPIRLNYPPEEAQSIIRDQTRSTFLEELTFPFRESVYINGFEPKDPKDDIWYEGQHYRQKIIVKAVPSGYIRIIVGFVSGILFYVLYKQYLKEVNL